MESSSSGQAHTQYRRFVSAAISLIATVGVFYWRDPLKHPLVDDAGIVLRYLDNCARGHFYTYEMADGRVFGISGFVHGVFTQVLAICGIVPEYCLLISNIIGSLVFFYFFSTVQIRIYKSLQMGVVSVSALLIASQYLGFTFSIGLETPLHVGIVAWSIWLFETQSSWIGVAAATMVISKLDAIPLASLLLLAVAMQARSESTNRRLKHVAIGFFVPIVAWILATYLLFGSPIPQTLLAKMISHPSSGWFPFAMSFVTDRQHALTSYATLAAITMILLISVKRRQITTATILSGASILTLLQYWFYNPEERMAWYYTLPELLFLWSLLLMPALFGNLRSKRLSAAYAIVVVVGRFGIPQQFIQDFNRYLDIVEPERKRVGLLANEVTAPGGLLVTGHGYVARASQHRVLDYSGLNSRRATQYRGNVLKLIEDVRASTVVIMGFLPEDVQRDLRFRLAGSFYSLRTQGTPAWRVFTAASNGLEGWSVPLEPNEVIGAAAQGQNHSFMFESSQMTFHLTEANSIRSIQWGVVQKLSPERIVLNVETPGGTYAERCDVAAEPLATCHGSCTSECRLRIDSPGPISVHLSADSAIRIVEPSVTFSDATKP